jgi:hypothetical protein
MYRTPELVTRQYQCTYQNVITTVTNSNHVNAVYMLFNRQYYYKLLPSSRELNILQQNDEYKLLKHQIPPNKMI